MDIYGEKRRSRMRERVICWLHASVSVPALNLLAAWFGSQREGERAAWGSWELTVQGQAARSVEYHLQEDP